MPTNKPRFSVTADEELLMRINSYQHQRGLDSQSKAIIELINIGLLREYSGSTIPVLSKDELRVLHALRVAPPDDQSQILKLASRFEWESRAKRSHSPYSPPQYDSITILHAYEIASDEERAEIDDLINEILLSNLDNPSAHTIPTSSERSFSDAMGRLDDTTEHPVESAK